MNKLKKWWYYNDNSVYSALIGILGSIGIGILIGGSLLILINIIWPFTLWTVNNPELSYMEKLATIFVIIFTFKNFSGGTK